MNKIKEVLHKANPLLNTFIDALVFVIAVGMLCGLGNLGLSIVCLTFGITYKTLVIIIIVLALLITIRLHSFDEIKWKVKHRKRKAL